MGSRQDFIDSVVYETSISNRGSVINLYESSRYGKVDMNGDPVIVSESKLRTLSNTSSRVFLLGFAADAILDFLSSIEDDITRKIVPNSEVLGKLFRPTKGWESSKEFYHRHMSRTFRDYANFLARFNRRPESFEEFISHLPGFVSSRSNDILPSTFFSGRSASIASTGLCTAFAGAVPRTPKQSDKSALTRSPEYVYWAERAARFGLMTVRDSPWRLLVDLRSRATQSYMRRYASNVDDMFATHHHNVHKTGFDIFWRYMRDFYVSYTSQKPLLTEIEYCGIKSVASYKFTRPIKRDASHEELSTDRGWVKLLVDLREAEVKGFSLNKQHITNLCEEILSEYGFSEVMKFLWKITDLNKKEKRVTLDISDFSE